MRDMTQPRLLGGRYELDGVVGRGGMAEVYPGPRHPPGPHRRGEDAARGPGPRPDLPGQVPPGGPVRRLAEPPVHRRGLRHRRGHDRHHARPVHRDGVRRRPDPARPAARRPAAAARARAGDHRRRAAGAGLQPPQRHRAPRHQARQRDADPDRRGQGDGLRHRPRGRRRPGHHDADRAGHRHRPVPVARSRPGASGWTPAATCTRPAACCTSC